MLFGPFWGLATTFPTFPLGSFVNDRCLTPFEAEKAEKDVGSAAEATVPPFKVFLR